MSNHTFFVIVLALRGLQAVCLLFIGAMIVLRLKDS